MAEQPLCQRIIRTAMSATAILCIAAAFAHPQTAPHESTSSGPASKAVGTSAYEVISIKPSDPGSRTGGTRNLPNGFEWANEPLDSMVLSAYDLIMDSQISGLPDWARWNHYDIKAKVDEETAESWQKLPVRERWKQEKPLMQALLADRCQFKAHEEMRELPVYDLVIAKDGLKMKEAPPKEGATEQMTASGKMIVHAMTVDAIIYGLSGGELGRMVVDKTGP